eukprot:TRINITY_DN32461_c0_g1_i1.p1 TRINITY_DN32461_c0_g1~~TRINITY_DN32461_c0_g1_i1.p1  ORF type:complete len:569 (+),score=214.76 TRINITY_DN32461_c0_g1_i1:48-1709(+)
MGHHSQWSSAESFSVLKQLRVDANVVPRSAGFPTTGLTDDNVLPFAYDDDAQGVRCSSATCSRVLSRRLAELRNAREMLAQRHAQMVEQDVRVGVLEKTIEQLRGDIQEARRLQQAAEDRVAEVERGLQDKGLWWLDMQRQQEQKALEEMDARVRAEQDAARTVGELQCRINSLDAEVEAGSCRLQQQAMRVRYLESELAEAEKKLESRGAGNRTLIDELNRCKEDCADEMERERQACAEAVRRLSTESQQKDKVVAQLRGASEEITSDCRRLTKEAAQLRAEAASRRDEAESARADLARQAAESEAATADLRAAHESALRALREQLQQESRLRQTQESSAEASAKALDRERAARQQAAGAAARKAEELQEFSTAARGVQRRLETEIESLRGDVAVAMEDIREREARLHAQQSAFRESLDRKEDEKRALEEQLVCAREARPGLVDDRTEETLYHERRTVRGVLSSSISDVRWLARALQAAGTEDALTFAAGNQETAEEQDLRVRGMRQDGIALQLQEDVSSLVNAAQYKMARMSGAGGSQIPEDSDPEGCAIM